MEKLTVAQLVKFTDFYRTRRFITVVAKTLYWASNPVSIRTPYICNKYFNIILPSSSWSLKWYLYSRLLDQNANAFLIFLIRATCYLRPSYPPWFDHPTDIRWRVRTTEFLGIPQCSSVLRPVYSLHPSHTTLSNTVRPRKVTTSLRSLCELSERVHLHLNSVNQLIFVMVKWGVLFEVRTEFLNNI
jgi:hypothetical protein